MRAAIDSPLMMSAALINRASQAGAADAAGTPLTDIMLRHRRDGIGIARHGRAWRFTAAGIDD